MTTALRAANVYKVFGRDAERATRELEKGASLDEISKSVTVAVNNVSFEVEEGEIFVVMGLSGSGKSTLLRTINALGPATGGKIWINDTEITALSPSEIRELRKEKMSMVFQHFGLLPHRTVLENAAYPLEIRKVGRKEREEKAREALRTTGLEGWEDKYPDQLSGGMQQRVGLARALTAGTEILLMDEAFSALDPLIRRDMQKLLLEIQEKHRRTVIFITHDLNEAMYVGNRIAVMRNGQIDQIGTAEEILTSPANDYIAKFVSDVDRSRVMTASSVLVDPMTSLYKNDGPRVILRKLEEWDEDGGWVIDAGTRKLVGLIHAEDVAKQLRDNPKLNTIEHLIKTDYTWATPDTPLADLATRLAGSPITVPVVDEDNTFLGIVPRIAYLRALSEADPEEIPDEDDIEAGITAAIGTDDEADGSAETEPAQGDEGASEQPMNGEPTTEANAEQGEDK